VPFLTLQEEERQTESDAEENRGVDNLRWEFLGGLGLEEGSVKLNALLLNSSSPTHHVLPSSTVSSFSKEGDGEDTHAQTLTWKPNCYKGSKCFVTSSKNFVF